MPVLDLIFPQRVINSTRTPLLMREVKWFGKEGQVYGIERRRHILPLGVDSQL